MSKADFVSFVRNYKENHRSKDGLRHVYEENIEEHRKDKECSSFCGLRGWCQPFMYKMEKLYDKKLYQEAIDLWRLSRNPY